MLARTIYGGAAISWVSISASQGRRMTDLHNSERDYTTGQSEPSKPVFEKGYEPGPSKHPRADVESLQTNYP
jgi:hypothetical protein